jgi:hypothetical protein
MPGKRQEPRLLLLERLGDLLTGILRPATFHGLAAAPCLRLAVEVIEVLPLPRREEAAADEADGPFHAGLFVAPSRRHRAWLVAVVSAELKQHGIEPDRIADSLERRRSASSPVTQNGLSSGAHTRGSAVVRPERCTKVDR